MRRVVVGCLIAVGACGRINFDPVGGDNVVSGRSGTLAVGYGHVCEVRGTDVWCWGEGSGGQTGNDTQPKFVPTKVLALPPIQQVAAGAAHTCAITVDGDVWCWGYDEAKQLGSLRANVAGVLPPPPFEEPDPRQVVGLPGPAVDISAGGAHTCVVIAGGTAWCWGDNTQGQLGRGTMTSGGDPPGVVPNLSGVSAISVDDDTSCALHDDGHVSCWGDDGSSQVGDSGTNPVPSPFMVPNVVATQISVGGNHVCALVAGGAFECWGTNGSKELGNNGPDPQPVPMRSTLTGFTQIEAGREYTCAIDSQARVSCWGIGNRYVLGNNAVLTVSAPEVAVPDIGGKAVAVVAGADATCAVREDGATLCWGWGSRGQIGDGRGAKSSPQHVDLGGTTATLIAAGFRHSCSAGGDTVKCWGENESGQIGNGTRSDPLLSPTSVTKTWGTNTITQLGVGDAHTCVVAGGFVYCWGSNAHGAVGNGSTQPQLTPVLVDIGGMPAIQLAVRSDGNCVRRADREVWCWGWNDHGEVGDGTSTTAYSPVSTGIFADELVAGSAHMCLRASNQIACWGFGDDGRLGNGMTDQSSPTAVPVLQATALRAGGATTCAVDTGGMTECWGNNYYSLIDTNLPPLVTTPTVVARPLFEVGSSFACDPGAGCWGDAYYGALGDGLFDTTDTPRGFAGGVGTANALSVGDRHVCGVFTSGTYCWGDNDYGQLGIGEQGIAARPVVVPFP